MKKTLTLLALFLTALLSAQPRQTTYSTVRDISYTDSDDAYAKTSAAAPWWYGSTAAGSPAATTTTRCATPRSTSSTPISARYSPKTDKHKPLK